MARLIGGLRGIRTRRRRHTAQAESSAPPVVVTGAGIGGLLVACGLARDGHRVTVVERDEVTPAPDPRSAFDAERPGTPQAHQTHGFLGRLRRVLAEHHPEVLEGLEEVGGATMGMTDHLGDPRPGDEDLRVLVVRRTTFEHVLRRHAEATPGITFHTGVATALHAPRTDDTGRPVVEGLVLDDGTVVDASFVVASTGSRGDIVGWLDDIGVTCSEERHPGGLVYLTRWYRRSDPDAPWEPRLFGHLPYLKVLGVPGDGDSLSVTLAVPTTDAELRGALSDPDRFDRACRTIPTLDQFFGPDAPPVTPVGPVRPMGGFVNRRRRFVDDQGDPTVVGFHAVGDAHTTTNPILGRGCTLAAVQATLLASAVRAHPDDPVRRARAYEAACRADIDPWFEDAVLMARLESDPDSVSEDEGPAAAAARLVGALFAVGRDDPTMGRALARYVNLLRTPVQLMADDRLVGQVIQRASEPGAFDGAPVTGPSRDELLTAIAHPTAGEGPSRAGPHPVGTPVTPGTWPAARIHPTARHRRVDVGEVSLHVITAGPADGPPVILTHGFPELAYSWRNQIPLLADAGHLVVAVDQRGFGRSDAPPSVDAYDIHHLTSDLTGLLDALALPRATVVAHDWGALVADTFALLHPDRVTGLLTLSVAPTGRLAKSVPDRMDDVLGGAFNYVRYFQEPGRADAELAANVEELFTRGMGGPLVTGDEPTTPPARPDAGLIERLPAADRLPDWLTAEELDHYVAEFRRTGFTPALSWYRNLDRNWATTAQLAGQRLRVPTAFVTGSHDLMNLVFSQDLMEAHVTDHRFTVVIDGVGHHVQQEAPDEVTALVLRFLDEVSAEPGSP